MKYLVSVFLLLSSQWLWGQGSVEAEFDTAFIFDFPSLGGTHQKRVLIDQGHNTIYSQPYGKETAREMLRIMEADGFALAFSNQDLDSAKLKKHQPDLLIIHGMPNDKIKLEDSDYSEVLYKSPLKDNEVEGIAKYVFQGGSLMLFLSHFPGGSGALPLLEAFGVKFRDGYAYHPFSPGHNCGDCSHFIMTKKNEMMKMDHPVLANAKSEALLPDTVKFLCGAAVFRNPEDVILGFPNNSFNFTPTADRRMDLEEQSDHYAGMIGFEYGKGRVIVCTDQGIFRSLDLLIDDEKIPVTIHDPACDNAELWLNSLRWLTQLQ